MTTVNINESPNIILRIIWFVAVGWWLSGVWTVIAWVSCVTIIGLPIGLMMLNSLPQVTTLRARTVRTVVDSDGGVQVSTTPQYPFLIRALYFLVIGWWLSAVWLITAWAMGSTIIGLVISFWMVDRVPSVLVLTQN
ncbi:MAG: YccF domain-containing protein [Chloroflexales bacterium]|nr:YccF domain-containing protein [Chloroflexales bacterium]